MSYAQSIDKVNTELKTGKVSHTIDSLDILMSTSRDIIKEGIVLLTPADGDIGVSITPVFDWDDSENYPVYKIEIADNETYTNAITAYVTESAYNQVEVLLNSTLYFWRVIGGSEADRPVIVPSEPQATSFTVWDADTDPSPIYVYDNGGTPIPRILEAATDLAHYIGKSSGYQDNEGNTLVTVTPAGTGFPFPQRCIKVGFPNTFSEREETLIEYVEGQPIEITGNDEYNPTYPNLSGQEDELDWMNQAGTYNAVMSFIQDYIGVVWGWYAVPGTGRSSVDDSSNLGEAVPSKSELKINPISKRHSPNASVRNFFGFSHPGQKSPYGVHKDWMKKQRCFYSGYRTNAGHAFRGWFDHLHPLGDPGGNLIEVFALQPNETRNDPPQGRGAKLEVGDPLTIDTWFNLNVQGSLVGDGAGNPDPTIPEGIAYFNPHANSFSCSFGDGHSNGHSVDYRSKEMDYPQQGKVSTAGSNSITAENQTFIPDEHIGKTVRLYTIRPSNAVLFGSDLIEEGVVQSNTSNTLFFNSDFTNLIDSSVFFVIQEDDAAKYNANEYMITDRELLFAKRCADKLRANYPGEDFIVNLLAYGPARPAPIREELDPDVYVVNAANDFNDPNMVDGTTGQTHRQNLEDWLNAWGGNQVWRPNIGSGVGHRIGMWMCQANEIGTRLKDIIDRGCVGFTPDMFWEHSATQWPLYYVISQMLWDHTQNINDVMNKAYDTLFGEASIHIKAYYEDVEDVITSYRSHGANFQFLMAMWGFVLENQNVLEIHIANAKSVLTEGTDEYLRVEWVEAGYLFSKGQIKNIEYWLDYHSLGIITDETNLATNPNAIESDVNSFDGWSNLYGGTVSIDSVDTGENSNFSYRFDGEANTTRLLGAIRQDAIYDSRTGETDLGTATSGDTLTLNDSTKSWVENEHVGKTLLINPADPDNEDYAKIASNTSNTLIVETPFSISVDNTTHYKITDLFVCNVDAKHNGGENRYLLQRITSSLNNRTEVVSIDTVNKTITLQDNIFNDGNGVIVHSNPHTYIVIQGSASGTAGSYTYNYSIQSYEDDSNITVGDVISSSGLGGGITLNQNYVNWQTFDFKLFAGDKFRFREIGKANLTGTAWIDNLVIRSADPVNRQGIEAEWKPHRDAMVELVSGPKWENNNPIGGAVWGSSAGQTEGRRIINPESTNFIAPDPGLE